MAPAHQIAGHALTVAENDRNEGHVIRAAPSSIGRFRNAGKAAILKRCSAGIQMFGRTVMGGPSVSWRRGFNGGGLNG